MKGEKWFWIGIGMMAIGFVSGVRGVIKSEYERGYAAGADSLSDKHVNEVCMQWLFQSDLKTAKKRVCGK